MGSKSFTGTLCWEDFYTSQEIIFASWCVQIWQFLYVHLHCFWQQDCIMMETFPNTSFQNAILKAWLSYKKLLLQHSLLEHHLYLEGTNYECIFFWKYLLGSPLLTATRHHRKGQQTWDTCLFVKGKHSCHL